MTIPPTPGCPGCEARGERVCAECWLAAVGRVDELRKEQRAEGER